VLHSDREATEAVFLNGRLLSLDEARISPLDRGFLYGDGIFTTMRAEDGQVLYLKDHLDRLQQSLTKLNLALPSSVAWEATLVQLLQRNRLEKGVATVKIVVTRGPSAGPGLPDTAQATVVIYAGRYEPPQPSAHRAGYRLHVFRNGFSPPLSNLKSLNYLYHLVARQAALDAGADEAVMLDGQGRLAETAVGSLLLRTGGKWWTPESAYQLRGITLRHVMQILDEAGSTVARRPADAADLFAAETVWVLNSLMGVMPVVQVDERPVAAPAPEEAARLSARFFARGRQSEPFFTAETQRSPRKR
jgi:branched-chain amino acid aminotransferase